MPKKKKSKGNRKGNSGATSAPTESESIIFPEEGQSEKEYSNSTTNQLKSTTEIMSTENDGGKSSENTTLEEKSHVVNAEETLRIEEKSANPISSKFKNDTDTTFTEESAGDKSENIVHDEKITEEHAASTGDILTTNEKPESAFKSDSPNTTPIDDKPVIVSKELTDIKDESTHELKQRPESTPKRTKQSTYNGNNQSVEDLNLKVNSIDDTNDRKDRTKNHNAGESVVDPLNLIAWAEVSDSLENLNESVGNQDKDSDGGQANQLNGIDVVSTEPDSGTGSPDLNRKLFNVDERLNSIIRLWSGKITLLSADAIINSTNESLTDKNTLSQQILADAGDRLRDAMKQVAPCRTGEVKLTKGFDLPAANVIHTVGPRYNTKYRTAAESALFNCYRGILQLAREQGFRTVAFPVINSVRRGYPPELGAHIGVRCVRRFLEKYGRDHFDAIVFCCLTNDLSNNEFEIYLRILRLYFPRNSKELEFSHRNLPIDIGNEDGEPVIPERQIPSILDKRLGGGSSENTSASPLEEQVAGTDFTSMAGDHDTARKAQIAGDVKQNAEREALQRYQRLLKDARAEDLASFAALKMIWKAQGMDKFGRPIVCVVGRHFDRKMDMQKAIYYAISIMDSIVEQDYTIVYFHTETTRKNYPDMSFLKTFWSSVDRRYKKNLKALHIVHPTIFAKMMIWFVMTFANRKLGKKIKMLKGTELLYDSIPLDSIEIPDFIKEYDMKINGKGYFSPVKELDSGVSL